MYFSRLSFRTCLSLRKIKKTEIKTCFDCELKMFMSVGILGPIWRFFYVSKRLKNGLRLYLDSSVGRAHYRYRIGHEFELTRSSLNFFSGFNFTTA